MIKEFALVFDVVREMSEQGEEESDWENIVTEIWNIGQFVYGSIKL